MTGLSLHSKVKLSLDSKFWLLAMGKSVAALGFELRGPGPALSGPAEGARRTGTHGQWRPRRALPSPVQTPSAALTTLWMICVLSIATQNMLDLSACPRSDPEASSPGCAPFGGSSWCCWSSSPPRFAPGRDTRLLVPSASTLRLKISPSHTHDFTSPHS